MLPRREGVKGGAISGGLRQIGRDHMYDVYFKSVPKKQFLKPGHTHLPYILLLLGSQLGGEIYPHFNRMQNSKGSNMFYKQTILRNNQKSRNYR